MSTSSSSYDIGSKKSGTFGKTVSQTFMDASSMDSPIVYRLAILAVMIVVVSLIYQYSIKGISDDFASVRWGPYQFDPVKGQTVHGEDGAALPNENKSTFANFLFGSTGTILMLVINLLAFMFGGSRDIVYMFRRWLPRIPTFVCHIIAILPIVIHIIVLVMCTIAIRSNSEAVGSYFYAYSITAIVISAICCSSSWLRYYWSHKEGLPTDIKPTIILSVINLAMLVYGATLLGYYASTSDDIKAYLKTRAVSSRGLNRSIYG